MMLASDALTVSLVTTHTALAAVPRLLTPERIVDVIRLTADAMRRLGRRSPRIVVCGLNPHGGEGGLFGREEITAIRPAVQRARRSGLNVEGPLPPDTAFLRERRRATDAYVAMYHDQGLIPFKMLAFDRGVNVTLGLPIVRTSPDHGTAFDIAWKGKASPNSMIQSVLLALRLAG
jgi:4-hydroxythreonine-4-phosphate dehydrogenase